MSAALTTNLILALAVGATEPEAEPAAAPPAGLEERFRDTVKPFLDKHCSDCHGLETSEAELNLGRYDSVQAVAADHRRWDQVLVQLRSGSMPPEDASPLPDDELRAEVIVWITEVRRKEAERNAGDPGAVPPRRLSNAEYDYSIRDLTGVDLRPTREFPVDPANEAGFDNTAESLTTSPALVKKSLDAARRVSEHLVLQPEGFTFADHPVVADTDRDKFCVRRVIDFYRRQPTDLAEYFFAAWRFRHRAALGEGDATLDQVAAEAGVTAKYLATVWAALDDPAERVGPVAAVQALWHELPSPGGADDPGDAARTGCERLRDFVVDLRGKLVPEIENLEAPGIHDGSQCFVLWKNRKYAENRRRYLGGAAEVRADGLPADSAAAKALVPPTDPAELEQFESSYARFCSIFPDAFYVSERARVYLDAEKEKENAGRLLSAGFHSMTGYFRDDGPLYELILDGQGQRELDALWLEFDVVTGAPIRQHTSFLWFERTDSRWMRDPVFDFARAEDKNSTSAAMISRLSEVYLAKARENGASETALEAIEVHFENISASIRRVEETRKAAEPSHVAALEAFAERAYRRPLTSEEREEITAFYRSLRDEEGLPHEEAVRDAVVRVLMSPNFCFRVDAEPSEAGAERSGVRPLSDYALASRLSYFLWSSLPDEELLRHAAAGDLHRPEVLVAQTRRMLRDGRVRGFATEFGGNWLDFRRFEEHNSVDRGRFPDFNDELRQSMFEEPVRYLMDVAQQDRPVLDLLYGTDTFVNRPLAAFYGLPEPPADEWMRVEGADSEGRGGLLPMAVFLTKNAPGLRTSPVKRGYWVVRRLLGEHIPPPPPTVPELPEDESKLGELTLREALARHRADASCARCHDRFDGIGVAFEGYGPVGERRKLDLGGRPVETAAAFPGGGEGNGIEGLRAYLREHRQEEFVENLCRKVLSYGLGRGLIPSDDLTVETMRKDLESNGYRFGTLIESVVLSPQFLNRRTGSGPVAESTP